MSNSLQTHAASSLSDPLAAGDTSTTQTWPPERFYWALSDASLPRAALASRPAPAGLLTDLASDAPAPVEELHAVAASLPSESPNSPSRTLIIAAPRHLLEHARSSGAIAVVPAALPEFIAGDSVKASSLNMLVGDFEPHSRRAARTRSHLVAAALVAVLAGLMAFGLYRRAEQSVQHAGVARELLATIQAGPSALSSTQELDRVRRINQAAAKITPPADAVVALAELLTVWPNRTSAKPQSLNVTASEANLSVVVEGDPSDFLRSFRPPQGWSLEEPRMNTVGGSTSGSTSAASVSRISLRLTRTSVSATLTNRFSRGLIVEPPHSMVYKPPTGDSVNLGRADADVGWRSR